MPIRMRLALVVSAASILLFVVGGAVGIWFFSRGLNESLDDRLAQSARLIASAVTKDHRRGIGPTSLAAHPRSLQRLSGRRGVAAIQLFGPNGVFVDVTATGERLLTSRQLTSAGHRDEYINVTIGSPPNPLRAIALPVPAMPGWVVVVGNSTTPNQDATREVELGIVVAGVVAVAVATGGAWWLAGAALAPVERMRRRAAEISEHDLAGRLDIPGTSDELGALGKTMDGLLARYQGALARQRAFVADAGHELRTPLAVLSGELELAERPGRSIDQLAFAVHRARQETQRISQLAQDLLLLATVDEGQTGLHVGPLATAGILAAAAAARKARLSEQGVRLEVHVAEGAEMVQGDALRLRQAIDNILDNALRVAPRGSLVTLASYCVPEAGEVTIEVSDEGPGFSPDFLPYAFDRFARPDGARGRDAGGTGLGLAVVRSIAEAHGGRAEAENRPVRGASVRIVLPLRKDRLRVADPA